MIVTKFGGSSVANAEQFKKVYGIIKDNPERRVVVVSAPGKRSKDDIKVTDLLINCANKHYSDGNSDKEREVLVNRYREIALDLDIDMSIINEIDADIKRRLEDLNPIKEKYIDKIKASGEDACAKLMAAYLQKEGLDASYISPKGAGLFLSNESGNAQVLEESYENLSKLTNNTGIIVFPGFFGYTPEGELVTFSRGGSDVTGSILAVAVKASLYENFTDVDSVYAVNPNYVDNPKAINNITYREMRELSYGGFGVLHEEALAPVYKENIPVKILNTNNPKAAGTLISTHRPSCNNPVVGIASDTGFVSIYVRKYLMNREIGFGRRLLQILEEEKISYEHIPSGIDDISVIIRGDRLDKDSEKRIMERIKEELAAEVVSIKREIALVMLVGENMRQSIGVAARATRAFAEAKVNLDMINQGSSEVSMMFGVDAGDEIRAVQSLYNEFFA